MIGLNKHKHCVIPDMIGNLDIRIPGASPRMTRVGAGYE